MLCSPLEWRTYDVDLGACGSGRVGGSSVIWGRSCGSDQSANGAGEPSTAQENFVVKFEIKSPSIWALIPMGNANGTFLRFVVRV